MDSNTTHISFGSKTIFCPILEKKASASGEQKSEKKNDGSGAEGGEKKRRRHGILDKQPDQPAPGTSGEANPDGRGQEVLPDLPPQPVNPEKYTNSTLKYFLLTSYNN